MWTPSRFNPFLSFVILWGCWPADTPNGESEILTLQCCWNHRKICTDKFLQLWISTRNRSSLTQSKAGKCLLYCNLCASVCKSKYSVTCVTEKQYFLSLSLSPVSQMQTIQNSNVMARQKIFQFSSRSTQSTQSNHGEFCSGHKHGRWKTQLEEINLARSTVFWVNKF